MLPLKSGKMTAKEAIFIGHMAATGDPTYAARMAGYAQPDMRGREMMKNENIGPVARRAILDRARSYAPNALDYMNQVVRDEKEATRNRLTAANNITKLAMSDADGGEVRELHQMSEAELQSMADALKRKLADMAKPVIEHEPDQAKGDVFG